MSEMSTGKVIALCVAAIITILILVGGGVACEYMENKKCGDGYFWGRPDAFSQYTCIPVNTR